MRSDLRGRAEVFLALVEGKGVVIGRTAVAHIFDASNERRAAHDRLRANGARRNLLGHSVTPPSWFAFRT